MTKTDELTSALINALFPQLRKKDRLVVPLYTSRPKKKRGAAKRR